MARTVARILAFVACVVAATCAAPDAGPGVARGGLSAPPPRSSVARHGSAEDPLNTTSAAFRQMVQNTHVNFKAQMAAGPNPDSRKLIDYTVSGACNGCGFNKVVQPRLLNDINERAVVMLQVSMRNAAGATKSISCSGTLIDSQTILTAAHCVIDGGKGTTGYQYTSARVFFRVLNNAAQNVVSTCGWAYWTGFRDQGNYSYDIALLRLCTAVTDTVPLGYRVSTSQGACLLRMSARALGYPQGYQNSYNAMYAATGIGKNFNPAPFCGSSAQVLSSTDIYPGMSGGPLMLLETPLIIGINSRTCSSGCPNGFTPIYADSISGLYKVFGLTGPSPQ